MALIGGRMLRNPGYWTLRSQIDPRFNSEGKTKIAWLAEEAAEEWVKKKEKELKCKQPKDLELSVVSE